MRALASFVSTLTFSRAQPSDPGAAGAPYVMLARRVALARLATPAIPSGAGSSGPLPATARRTFGGCEEDAVQRAGMVDARWAERPTVKDFVGPSRRRPRETDR
jgi:hypothetical protein